MSASNPTVSELIVEGFDEGGFRAEHALALAMADASPKLRGACKSAVAFLNRLPKTEETVALIKELDEALFLSSTSASRNAS